MLGYHGISTYDYVVNQRIDQTVNQTLSQFNQLNQNYHHDQSTSKFNPPKVRFHSWLIIYIYSLFF